MSRSARSGQEALGAASDGAADGASTDGAVDGAEMDGAVVAAGVLQATTAPPTDAASARASRIRLNMVSGSSVARERQGLHR